MFTQCPACETIFKISAEVLRAAAGEVRCGRCGEIFNALRSLAEEPRAFTSGESPQEQEARADKILRAAEESPIPVATDPAAAAHEELDLNLEEFASDGSPGTQIAHLEIQGADELDDWDQEEEPAAHTTTRTIADDPSMEFTLPPGELDRIFVEARPHHFVRGKHNLLLNAGIDEIEPISPEQLGGDLPAATSAGTARAEPISMARQSATAVAGEPLEGEPEQDGDPQDLDVLMAQPLPATEMSEAVPMPRAAPMVLVPAEPTATTLQERDVPDYLRAVPAAAAAEPRRNDWIEQVIPTRDIEEFEPTAEPHRGRWAAAAVLFALLLGVQVAHHHRDALAQSPTIGSAVRSLYQIAGYPIPLTLNLGAFEVRQWGVTGDANASGTLRVRASLINTGSTAQPYPLLRLTLADRFGTRVGQRDFLPAEYLRQAPTRPLDPGERADTLVEIIDPGKTAEGFEIDVCERRLDARVICANESPARPR